MCPHTDGAFGTCVEECSNDMDCQGQWKCCSNGCGHTCVDPVLMCEFDELLLIVVFTFYSNHANFIISMISIKSI